MNQYELCCIISDATEEKEVALISQNIKKIVESLNGKIVVDEDWGRKRLAFPIQGKEYGYYVYFQIELPADKVTALNSKILLMKEVIRYLLITLELVKEKEPKKKAIKKIAKIEETSVITETEEEPKEEKADKKSKVRKITKKVAKKKVEIKPKEEAVVAPTEIIGEKEMIEEEQQEEERMAELDEKLKEILED